MKYVEVINLYSENKDKSFAELVNNENLDFICPICGGYVEIEYIRSKSRRIVPNLPVQCKKCKTIWGAPLFM